jgi:hypothetical protein
MGITRSKQAGHRYPVNKGLAGYIWEGLFSKIVSGCGIRKQPGTLEQPISDFKLLQPARVR